MHLKGLRISVEGHEERHRPEIVRLVVLLRSLARDHLPYCAHQVVVGATQLLTEAAQDDTHTERGPVLLRGSGAQGTASHELSQRPLWKWEGRHNSFLLLQNKMQSRLFTKCDFQSSTKSLNK